MLSKKYYKEKELLRAIKNIFDNHDTYLNNAQALAKKLPKPEGAEIPYVEGLYYLLLTGDIPSESEVADVADEFNKRKKLPDYVYQVIDAFPPMSHPMALFSSAILTMNRESV